MSLPIQNIRERLQELIKISKRGYMARLSGLSGIPDGTIHRIAYGKQNMITYKIWKVLHAADPQLPPPPSLEAAAGESRDGVKDEATLEREAFAAAVQHFYPLDEKFHDVETFALSVGVAVKNVRRLLSGDDAYTPNAHQKKTIAHAFGMSLDELLQVGRRIQLERRHAGAVEGGLPHLDDFDMASTTHPDLVQIVKMAEKLPDEKILLLKELTLKMLLSHVKK